MSLLQSQIFLKPQRGTMSILSLLATSGILDGCIAEDICECGCSGIAACLELR